MRSLFPIILKEFTQATHQIRSFVLRLTLPAVAVVILLPGMAQMALVGGQDWRRMSLLARPTFQLAAWLQLLTFPVLALTYAQSTFREEWTKHTMDILCTTPLSRMSIVYGKFACALGKVLCLGLTLLPVMGVWYHMGRIPRVQAVGTVGVIVVGTLLFAALAYVQAAGVQPRRRRITLGLDLLLLYLLVPVVLGRTVYPSHPLLVAAVPHWSLSYVLTATAPGGMSPAGFIRLAVGVPLGVSALALAAAPFIFRRALRQYVEAGERRGWASILPAALRRPRRPTMKDDEDPFAWQEKGPPTRVLRWSLWVAFGVAGVGVWIAVAAGLDLALIWTPTTLFVLAWGGAIVVTVMSGIYGTQVFAREKEQRTAHALLMTGASPPRVCRAKMWALLWAVRYYAVLLTVLVLLYALTTREAPIAGVAAVVALAWLGPPAAGAVGLAFGVVARTPARACAWIVMGQVWFGMFCLTGPLAPIGAVVGFVLMTVGMKLWDGVLLSMLLGFVEVLIATVIVGAYLIAEAAAPVGGGTVWWLWLIGILAGTIPNIVYWPFVAARTFPLSILDESAYPVS